MENTETVTFVQASNVFDDDVWTAFIEGTQEYSWGNNNYTLASKDGILKALDNIDEDEDTPNLQKTKDRIESLPDNVYINLEG